MDIDLPLPLLGGLTPAQFMRRHWHKKPLVVRQAIPGFKPPVGRSQLLAMAASEDTESRFIQHQGDGTWKLRHGPIPRRALPSLSTREWTVLVQGVDLHDDTVHALLQRFAFVPQARLDDLMISFATDGGGVGPHYDSYDVFLLQAHGKRRWRIGKPKKGALVEGMPLKILANFEPEEEYVLEPGDLLYLPPHWEHDGIAEGECMTYSIGFRSPQRAQLAHEVLLRMADAQADEDETPIYRDPRQQAVAHPGAIPSELHDFALDAVRRALDAPQALARALGEALSEPKPSVWFEPGAMGMMEAVALDRRTRMLYDEKHVFINGESYCASGRDALLMHRLADERHLGARALAQASDEALELLSTWCEAGWVHAVATTPET